MQSEASDFAEAKALAPAFVGVASINDALIVAEARLAPHPSPLPGGERV